MTRKDFKTEDRYCEYCGKKMERQYYPNSKKHEDMAHFKARKYCSRECMRKAFTNVGYNTATNRNTHISARKINALFLKKDKCEICGREGKLDVHHVDGNPNNNNLDNLKILCRSCHNKIHKSKGKCIICGEPVKGHGYCNKHYIRFKKYGNPYYLRGGDEREATY